MGSQLRSQHNIAGFLRMPAGSGTHRDQLPRVSLFGTARRFESGFGPGRRLD
jgi:hypothetical protein